MTPSSEYSSIRTVVIEAKLSQHLIMLTNIPACDVESTFNELWDQTKTLLNLIPSDNTSKSSSQSYRLCSYHKLYIITCHHPWKDLQIIHKSEKLPLNPSPHCFSIVSETWVIVFTFPPPSTCIQHWFAHQELNCQY
jgi:hypothetical protein